MTLAEAVAHYLAAMAHKANAYSHQELHRFARAVGLEREVGTLNPPDVAAYAESVVAAGGDVHGRLSPVKDFLAHLKKKGHSTHALASHVKIPRANLRAAAAASQAAAFETIPMTAEGIAALREEMEGLKASRVDIVETIRIAAADKDFRENAPLDAAKDQQGQTEARIRELEETLRRAVLIENKKDNRGAKEGSVVAVEDVATGKPFTYTLVASTEADPVAGKLSVDSPVGKALFGSTAGKQVTVQAPKGDRHYKVTSVK